MKIQTKDLKKKDVKPFILSSIQKKMPIKTSAYLNWLEISANKLIVEGESLISRQDRLLIEEKQIKEIAEKFKTLSENFCQISDLIRSHGDSSPKFTLDTSIDGVCFIVHYSD